MWREDRRSGLKEVECEMGSAGRFARALARDSRAALKIGQDFPIELLEFRRQGKFACCNTEERHQLHRVRQQRRARGLEIEHASGNISGGSQYRRRSAGLRFVSAAPEHLLGEFVRETSGPVSPLTDRRRDTPLPTLTVRPGFLRSSASFSSPAWISFGAGIDVLGRRTKCSQASVGYARGP